MKKIGIIGGLGPESTIEYYSGLIKAFHQSYDSTGFPEIVLESLNLKECLAHASNNEWEKLADIIVKACNNLQHSGAGVGAIASNTPHKVFSVIQERTSLPLISIVEATREFVAQKQLKELILLGTRFTMSSSFYSDVFSLSGIQLNVPGKDDQDYIQKKIFEELQTGIIKEETKHAFLSIVEGLQANTASEGVILACTELPLLLKPNDISMAYIDPTQIHISAIVEACKGE